MQLVQDDWEIQIVLIAIWLIIFGAHMIILFNIRVMMLMFVNKWSYMLLKSCSLLNLESLAYIEDIYSPIQHMPCWCSFLDPHLTTYYSNVGLHIIVVLELGKSILSPSIFLAKYFHVE